MAGATKTLMIYDQAVVGMSEDDKYVAIKFSKYDVLLCTYPEAVKMSLNIYEVVEQTDIMTFDGVAVKRAGDNCQIGEYLVTKELALKIANSIKNNCEDVS